MKAARSGSANISRHGLLPVRYPQSKKMVADRYRIFGDTKHKFTCRRSWNVLARIWLKIKLTGDEVLESIESIEIPAGGQPAEVKIGPPPGPEIRWVAKPPVKLYELKQIIETGIRFAEDSVSSKARDLQNRQIKNRLPALARMRAYYRQLAEETAGSGSKETDTIRAEYHRRLREEIHYAQVKATLELVALETMATPVQHLKWELQRGTQIREVVSAVNLYSGRVSAPVRCDICGDQISMFGLSESNKLTCINCRNCCDEDRHHGDPNPKNGGITQSCPKKTYQLPLFQGNWNQGPR